MPLVKTAVKRSARPPKTTVTSDDVWKTIAEIAKGQNALQKMFQKEQEMIKKERERAQKDWERAQKEREREQEMIKKDWEREWERAQKEREREQERVQKERERERERAQKEREREQEMIKKDWERERERVQKEREREQERVQKERKKNKKERKDFEQSFQKALKETQEIHKETEKALKETQEAHKETEKAIKETQEAHKETEIALKEAQKNIGGLNNTLGSIVERIMTPGLPPKFSQFGLIFDRISTVKWAKDRNNPLLEIDGLLENGDKAMAVEVKTTLKIEDVNKHIKRMEKIRTYAGARGDTREFLGAIAAVIITASAKQYALDKGFYIIEPSGEDVQITAPANGAKIW